MIWLTWRQHRQNLYAIALALGGLGAVYLALRGALSGYLSHSGLASCLTHPDEGCGALMDGLRERYPSLLGLMPFLNLAPLLAGVFVGAR